LTLDAHTPIGLWLFIVGVVLYSAAPFLPWLSFLRFPRGALFSAAPALAVIAGRTKRAYWVTVAIVGLSMVLPFLNRWRFPTLYHLTSVDVYWFTVPPALLLGLLFSPRVRRYVAQPNRADEVTDTRCNWCNRSEGELDKVVIGSWRRFGFGRAPEPTEYWVHPEHERPFRVWHEKKERYAKRLPIALLGSVIVFALIMPTVGFQAPGLAAGLAGAFFVAFGIAYLVLPSGDVSTIRWLGLRRALAFGRWTGAVLVLVGLGLLFLAVRSF
jgi:hypothetical protein